MGSRGASLMQESWKKQIHGRIGNLDAVSNVDVHKSRSIVARIAPHFSAFDLAAFVNLGAKQIYIYEDLKITFMNGKVSDVQ